MERKSLFLAICWFVVFFCGCQKEEDVKYIFSEIDYLQPDTPVGVGIFLDYVDKDFLIFQAEFGLFGFDLEKNEIRFSFDLKEAIGTANFQGTEDSAVVHVSPDGTQIEVYSSDSPNTAYYIQTSDGSYEKKDRKLFEYAPVIETDDANWGELFSENSFGAIGTLMDIQFRRGGEIWKIFENYDFPEIE